MTTWYKNFKELRASVAGKRAATEPAEYKELEKPAPKKRTKKEGAE